MTTTYVPRATLHVACSVFDPGVNADQRAQASHALTGDVIPEGAIIVGYFVKNDQTFTSAGGDAGTIALSLDRYTGTVRTAVAISDASNPWDAGTILGMQSTATALTAPLSGGCHVIATVAVQNLTAGRCTIGIVYALIG